MSDIDANPTVRDLHRKAMARADEGRLLMAQALGAYQQAAAWERQALDRVRDIPDNEPTYSILDISYRSLVLLSEGKLEAAKALGDGVDLGRRTA